MHWLTNLLNNPGIAGTLLLLSLVISLGMLLSKIKIRGISFGITWILFAGIAISGLGLVADKHMLHLLKEFGLILFVYSIGLQVGPGFFSSFKKGGIKFNILALFSVLIGASLAVIISKISNLNISTTVGILSGAVTNTPGLGAAQQTFFDLNNFTDPTIALGYAVAYPMGVVGIILSIALLKSIFRVNIDHENNQLLIKKSADPDETIKISIELKNQNLFNKKIEDIKNLLEKEFIISRIMCNDGSIKIAGAQSELKDGQKLLVILRKGDKDIIVAFIGKEFEFIENDWDTQQRDVVSRRIIVTKESINGKSLSQLKFGKAFSITVTRVNRAGLDLIATPHLKLQIGDKLTVVGTTQGVESAANHIGNAMKRLREPNVVALFLGISVGIMLGSIPLLIPGIPQPIKLGLAGGPLIVAILMSRFGTSFKIVTYTTVSANLMLREIGIALFLASVGLDAGPGFVDIVLNGSGAEWMIYGLFITVIPLIVTGVVAIKFLKVDFFSVSGLLAGSYTDPPALAFANSTAKNDIPSVSYATVYPLTMFLRVLTAQLLIILF